MIIGVFIGFLIVGIFCGHCMRGSQSPETTDQPTDSSQINRGYFLIKKKHVNLIQDRILRELKSDSNFGFMFETHCTNKISFSKIEGELKSLI